MCFDNFEHICVKNVQECSFMHERFTTLLTLGMIVQQVVYKMRELVYFKACDFLTILYNFTHFGYDCATGCLQNERACLFQSL